MDQKGKSCKKIEFRKDFSYCFIFLLLYIKWRHFLLVLYIIPGIIQHYPKPNITWFHSEGCNLNLQRHHHFRQIHFSFKLLNWTTLKKSAISRVFNNFELKGAPTLAQKSTKRRTIFFLPKSATFLVKGAQFLTHQTVFIHRFF